MALTDAQLPSMSKLTLAATREVHHGCKKARSVICIVHRDDGSDSRP